MLILNIINGEYLIQLMHANKGVKLSRSLLSLQRRFFFRSTISKNIKAFEKPPESVLKSEYWRQRYYRLYPFTMQYVKNILNIQKNYLNDNENVKTKRIAYLVQRIDRYLKYSIPKQKNFRNLIYGIGPIAVAVIQCKEPQFEGHKMRLIQTLLESRFVKKVQPQQLLKIIQFIIQSYTDNDSRIKLFHFKESNFLVFQLARTNIISYHKEQNIDENIEFNLFGRLLLLISIIQQRSRQNNIFEIRKYCGFFRVQPYHILFRINKCLKQALNSFSEIKSEEDLNNLQKFIDKYLNKETFQFVIYYNRCYISLPQTANQIKQFNVQLVVTLIKFYIKYQKLIHKNIPSSVFFNRIFRYFTFNSFYQDSQGVQKNAKKQIFQCIVSSLEQKQLFFNFISNTLYQRQIFLNYLLSFVFSLNLIEQKISCLDQFAIIPNKKMNIPVLPQIVKILYNKFKAETYERHKIDQIFSNLFPQMHIKLDQKKFQQSSQYFRGFQKNIDQALTKYMKQHQGQAKINQLILGFQVNYLWQKQKIVLLIDHYESFTFVNFYEKQYIKYRDSVLLTAGYKIAKIHPNQFYSWDYQKEQQSIQLGLSTKSLQLDLTISLKLQILRKGKAIWVC